MLFKPLFFEVCYSNQTYTIRHTQGSPNTPTIKIKMIGMLCKHSLEASNIWKFWSLIATALLSPTCLQAACGQALLHHASCQLPPCHELSTYISGWRRNWRVKGVLNQPRPMETSSPPQPLDLCLGLPAPCGWGQLQRIQGQMSPGAAGNKRLLGITDRPATKSE